MEPVQQGDKVTGSDPAYSGQIEAEVRRREPHGRWIEGPRLGGITFMLAADGRVPADAAGVTVDQVGARQALRTFVMADNAAWSGNLNEWAKAAAVMEFGDAGASLAPGQKLAAFVDGVIALVADVPPGSAQVGVTAITPAGVEIEFSCTLNVRSAADERADKTALMLGMQRLADRMRVQLGSGDPVAAPALSAVAT